MISVNQGIGTSVPEKCRRGGIHDVCYQGKKPLKGEKEICGGRGGDGGGKFLRIFYTQLEHF